MARQRIINHRIKATEAVSDDESSAASLSNVGIKSAEPAEPAEHHEETISTEGHSGDELASQEADMSTISFGALAKAQESLSKRDQDPDGLRRGLVHLPYENEEANERKAGKSDHREHLRSSKHAPAEMSSKKAVSRKREVIPIVKRDVRDPRFEPVSGSVNEEKAKKMYGFLDDYRESEMVDLKALIRQTKDASAKEQLKRSLLSMVSRKKAQQIKDHDAEIQRAHRAREKELVKQGKQPFYLKKGEQKKLALIQRFQGIKGKQLDKVIERRRKKNAQRGRKDMPEERRVTNG
ncbi:MAG: hypothetical protein LQ337_000690 [Flavoplaca oasis]|nr:MAG: hypothetical protein LQ337_000690 [Flavoplaca oasis]